MTKMVCMVRLPEGPHSSAASGRGKPGRDRRGRQAQLRRRALGPALAPLRLTLLVARLVTRLAARLGAVLADGAHAAACSARLALRTMLARRTFRARLARRPLGAATAARRAPPPPRRAVRDVRAARDAGRASARRRHGCLRFDRRGGRHGRDGGRRTPRRSMASMPGTSMRGMVVPISFSIASTRPPSAGVARVKEWPILPARPVRPMRWT